MLGTHSKVLLQFQDDKCLTKLSAVTDVMTSQQMHLSVTTNMTCRVHQSPVKLETAVSTAISARSRLTNMIRKLVEMCSA